MATESTKNTGDVYIINKFKVKNKSQPFRCIMIYQDTGTGFCFIKPLLYKIDLEIVMELFRIFTSYGPPNEVYVNSCSCEMVLNIEKHMKLLCPMFNIKFIKKHVDKNDITIRVVTKLHKWIEVTNRDQWEIGCCIVQREINTEVVNGKLSPHELYFKNLNKKHGSEADNDDSNDDSDAAEIHKKNDDVVEDKSEKTQSVQSLNTNNVEMKEEMAEFEDINATSKDISNHVIIYDGGISFPSFNKHKSPENVNVKEEKVDK